jgi:hypothetical protein
MACRMRVVGRVVTAMPTPMIAEQMVHPINACANIKHHCLRESRSIALRFKHEMEVLYLIGILNHFYNLSCLLSSNII